MDATPPDVVDAAAAAGFGACGLHLDPARTLPTALPVLRTRLDDCGVQLLDIEVVRLRSGRPADDHRALLDIAAELGAMWVLTVVDIPEPAEQIDRLSRLDEIAAEFGVEISLEFMAFTAVHTLADALNLAGTVPRCRVLVDALHLARTGGSAAEVALHASKLSYVQLCDAPTAAPGGGSPSALAEEARHNRLLPGDGELDLAGLVASIPADMALSVEVQSDELSATLTPRQRATAAYQAATALLA